MEIPTSIEVLRAYLAGYFDGEGCISINSCSTSPQLSLQLRSADKSVIQLFAKTFNKTYRICKPQKLTKRQQYATYLFGKEAQRAIRFMLPYLKAKHYPAYLALFMSFEKRGAGRTNFQLTEEEISKRLELRDWIHRFNQRVTIDGRSKEA